jgi:hypothetical protein
MRALLVLAAALLLAACGADEKHAVLEATPPSGGGGGGGLPGECHTIDGDPADSLTLNTREGPFDDVRQGSVFHITGGYHLVEDDVDVYVIGTICYTECVEVKTAPPLAPGSGDYASDFRVTQAPYPDKSRNCLSVSMIALDGRTLMGCEYHF